MCRDVLPALSAEQRFEPAACIHVLRALTSKPRERRAAAVTALALYRAQLDHLLSLGPEHANVTAGSVAHQWHVLPDALVAALRKHEAATGAALFPAPDRAMFYMHLLYDLWLPFGLWADLFPLLYLIRIVATLAPASGPAPGALLASAACLKGAQLCHQLGDGQTAAQYEQQAGDVVHQLTQRARHASTWSSDLTELALSQAHTLLHMDRFLEVQQLIFGLRLASLSAAQSLSAQLLEARLDHLRGQPHALGSLLHSLARGAPR